MLPLPTVRAGPSGRRPAGIFVSANGTAQPGRTAVRSGEDNKHQTQLAARGGAGHQTPNTARCRRGGGGGELAPGGLLKHAGRQWRRAPGPSFVYQTHKVYHPSARTAVFIDGPRGASGRETTRQPPRQRPDLATERYISEVNFARAPTRFPGSVAPCLTTPRAALFRSE